MQREYTKTDDMKRVQSLPIFFLIIYMTVHVLHFAIPVMTWKGIISVSRETQQLKNSHLENFETTLMFYTSEHEELL